MKTTIKVTYVDDRGIEVTKIIEVKKEHVGRIVRDMKAYPLGRGQRIEVSHA